MIFRFIRKRRPSVTGLILGGTVGLAVSLGYGLTGAWLCSGIRNCPASWEPFAVVSAIILVLITVAGVIAGIIGAKLYRIFDTALGDDGDTTTTSASSDEAGPSGPSSRLASAKKLESDG